MYEGVHLLDRRRLDHVEAVRAKQFAGNVLHVLPGAHVAAEQVLGPLDPLCHESSPASVGVLGSIAP